MPVLAAIDVGSNAMRLAIGMVNGDRTLTLLEQVREPVRLGKDVFTSGNIAEETIESAAEAFRRFRAVIDSHGAKIVKAVATSALREALNRDFFVDRIAQASGIDVITIGTEEEARLIYLAVSQRVNLKNKLAMLVDIGGGSTEITLASDGTIISTESFRMGAVRLLQLLEEKKHGERHFNRLVQEYVDATQKRMKKELGTKKIDLCVGTGGNIETLGDLRKDVLDKEKDSQIESDELDTLVKKLQAMSYEERIQEFRLRPDRADVIVPASMVLQRIIHQADISEVLIPRVGLKDGLLIDMVQELFGESARAHQEQVMASALQLGRKYFFDEQHATTVARHAVQLFDETRLLHNLGQEHKLLLEVSALLHDIGQFVNMADHHKHTHYLIMAAPVVGLSNNEIAMVANIGRYHRKSPPKLQHDPFRLLSPKDRVVVTKLAALLRIADAMDNEHGSKVTQFSAEYKKPKLVLKLKGEGDLLLEKWAIAKKSTMFEEVFSTSLTVDEL